MRWPASRSYQVNPVVTAIRTGLAALIVLLGLGACRSTPEVVAVPAASTTVDSNQESDPPSPNRDVDTVESGDDAELTFGGVDHTLTRDDPTCVPTDDPEITYEVAYQVVGDTLGAACLGDHDQDLVDTWWLLAELVPADQLRDLAMFAGFREPDVDAPTLAFVQIWDAAGSEFELAVNLDQLDDLDELRLTLIHEFSHVFTASPVELDRSIDEEDCLTYHSGEGCYEPDALMHLWVQEFWPGVNNQSDFDASQDAALDRCDADSGLLGSYAATNPEEDFAETFSAYVLQVEPDTIAQAQRIDWMDQFVGLREFRDRAVALDHGPLPNTFELCGS